MNEGIRSEMAYKSFTGEKQGEIAAKDEDSEEKSRLARARMYNSHLASRLNTPSK